MHADAQEGVGPPQPPQHGKVGYSPGRGPHRPAHEVRPSGERHDPGRAPAGGRRRAGLLPLGPAGELLAADLGVVPDVHGEAGVAQELLEAGGRGLRLGHGAQLGDQPRPRGFVELRPVRPGLGLHADDGPLGAGRPDADQGGAPDQRMGVEDSLAAHGVQVPVAGADPLRCAPAEPQASFGVEVAQVSGPVPDEGLRAAGAFLGRLVRGVRCGCAVVAPADGIALDQDLADAPGRQAGRGVEPGQRAVGDGGDGHPGAGDGSADTGPFARGGSGRGPCPRTGRGTAVFAGGVEVVVAEDLGGLDRGDRQHLRGPVRHMDARLLVEDGAQRGHDRVGHRGPAGDDAAQVGQRVAAAGGAGEVSGQVPQQGGRGEHGGDAESFQRVHEQGGIRLGDPGGRQWREDQGGSVDQVEHPVERQGDERDVVAGAAVDGFYLAGDGQRHAVGVLDSLGGARASGGEADHQQVVPAGRRRRRVRGPGGRGGGAQRGQRVAAAEPAPPQGDGHPYPGEGAAAQDAYELGEGRPDEGLGAHGPVAVQHAPHTHAGIDDDGHGPDPEQREAEGEQLGPGWGHQHRSRAPGDPGAPESAGQFLDRVLQLAVGDDAVAAGTAAFGVDDGRLLGKGAGVALEPSGQAVQQGGGSFHGRVFDEPRLRHGAHRPSGR